MLWLFENPIPAMVVGAVLVALALVSLVQTGRRVFLALAILLALMTIGLVVLEWVVVTPGELVADRVHALAADLERNEPQRVMEYISPRSPELRSYAERVLNEVKIKDAVVKSNLKVEADPNHNMATATFNAVIQLDAPRHDLVNYRHARLFVLKFRYENGQWLISEFHEDSPVGPRSEP